MTLTEEQREAIRVISKLPMAIGCQLCHPYIMKNYGSHFIVLRAMIDGSSMVEPREGFDLEAARAGIAHYRIENHSNVDTESAIKELVDQANLAEDALAEIERLRAENEEAQESLTAAYMLGSHEKAHEQAAHISELEVEIAELKADLEQSEICIQARLDVIDQQAARIKSLKKEIRRLKHESKVEQEFTNSYIKRLHDAEARIKELEEAHKRSGAKYAKIINELRSSVYANIPGLDVGKIGPDASESHLRPYEVVAADLAGRLAEDRRKSWQITEERKAAIWHAVAVLKENDPDDEHLWDEEIAVLRAMLREAE